MGVENVSGGSGSTSDLWGKSWKAERKAQNLRLRRKEAIRAGMVFITGATSARADAALVKAGIAIFVGSAVGKAVVAFARTVVAPERAPEIDNETMQAEIARWLRDQQVASQKNPKRGMAFPITTGGRKDALNEPLGRFLQKPRTAATTLIAEQPDAPGRRRTKRETDEPDKFWPWFERRWRQSPLKHQRMRQRRRRRAHGR